jgi:hypothetical protein
MDDAVSFFNNVDLARALLAGWLAGAITGLAVTAVVLIAAARSPSLAARLPMRGRLPVLGILMANALAFGLTLVGLVLGAVYHATSFEAGGGRFHLVVPVLLLAAFAAYVIVRGRLRAADVLAAGLSLGIAALAFGVFLPWLAQHG